MSDPVRIDLTDAYRALSVAVHAGFDSCAADGYMIEGARAYVRFDDGSAVEMVARPLAYMRAVWPDYTDD